MYVRNENGFIIITRKDDYRTIPLTKGYAAIVDVDDYEWLSKNKYQFDKGYAVRTEWENGKTARHIKMHREIMNAKKGTKVDHINGDKLYNRKRNLRFATQKENNRNTRKRKNCSSKYKGVVLDKKTMKYHSRINVDGKQKHLGIFDFEFEKIAARVYNSWARKEFGEFAKLNDIDERTPLILLKHPKKKKKKTSKYRGVDFCSSMKKWRMRLRYNSNIVAEEYFSTEKEAAIEYNKAATRYYGDKAKLNVI